VRSRRAPLLHREPARGLPLARPDVAVPDRRRAERRAARRRRAPPLRPDARRDRARLLAVRPRARARRRHARGGVDGRAGVRRRRLPRGGARSPRQRCVRTCARARRVHARGSPPRCPPSRRPTRRRNALLQAGRRVSKQLVVYLMCGRVTPELAEAGVEGGADLVELGFPFSDPLADGPVVRAAAERALAEGMRTAACLECLAEIRARVEVPLVPMTYASLFEAYGWERLERDARAAGADSLIVADLPADERPALRRVQLVAPTS